jgi:hypothetical protein
MCEPLGCFVLVNNRHTEGQAWIIPAARVAVPALFVGVTAACELA